MSGGVAGGFVRPVASVAKLFGAILRPPYASVGSAHQPL